MPVIIDNLKLPMEPKDACSFVQKATDKLGIFIDLDRCSELIALLNLRCIDISKEMQEIDVTHNIDIKNRNSIIQAFINCGASISDFQVNYKKPDALYLNNDARANLLNNDSFNDKGRKLLELYKTLSTYQYNISILKSFTKYELSTLFSYDNHRMLRVNPKWSLLGTSRIGSSTPNIQGLAKDLCDVFTYPKGYVFVRSDSSQIEPRINFSHFIRDELIMKMIAYYNDAYYGLLHYCTASDADLKLYSEAFEENFTPMEISDELKEKRNTIKTLTNAVSYGSNSSKKLDPVLSDSFSRRIKNHPARLSFERKVTQDVERGVKTFYGAFGTPVTPKDSASYLPGTTAYIKHMIRCGINNPVQTTASELMICGMAVAKQLLNETQDSYLMWYKHDEASFLVSEADAEKGYVDKFADVTAYTVKNWIPIGNEVLIGKSKPAYESYL